VTKYDEAVRVALINNFFL